MKKRLLIPSVAISLFSFLGAYSILVDSDVYAQRARVVGSNVRQTASVTKIDARASLFAAAASRNSGLRNSLSWIFGGKLQSGWNIYVPLISHTIGTDSAPDSNEFALRVAQWQRDAGLLDTGIVDTDTLEAFTRHWQSQRLGRSGLNSDDNLLSAPIDQFFDATRSPDLLQLEQQTYSAYKKMIAAAAKDLKHELSLAPNGDLAPNEKFLRIVSGYRSPEYQDALRKREPNAGRVALAKHSPHSTGHAIDIYVGGEPVKTLDSNRLIQVQTPVYKWLVKNAAKFGFYPYFYEPWHWEYVGK